MTQFRMCENSIESAAAQPCLSLTLEHGSILSNLAATRPLVPAPILFRYTIGVLPAQQQI